MLFENNCEMIGLISRMSLKDSRQQELLAKNLLMIAIENKVEVNYVAHLIRFEIESTICDILVFAFESASTLFTFLTNDAGKSPLRNPTAPSYQPSSFLRITLITSPLFRVRYALLLWKKGYLALA